MGLALFLLISGDALVVGLGLTGVGALVGLSQRRLGMILALAGIILALASAVPLSPLLYALLVLVFVAWFATASQRHCAQRITTGILLGTVLAVLVASGVLRPKVDPLPSDTRPVFVLGDSLAAGVGPDRSGTWPALLEEQTGRSVKNLARPGALLTDGSSQASAIPPGKSVVLIELGGNDLLGGIAIDRFAESLRTLLQHVSAPDRSIVMLELPLLPLQNGFGQAQRQVCAELGVGLIPRRVLAGAVALPGHTTDGLHLSPEGHRWLAARIAAWI